MTSCKSMIVVSCHFITSDLFSVYVQFNWQYRQYLILDLNFVPTRTMLNGGQSYYQNQQLTQIQCVK